MKILKQLYNCIPCVQKQKEILNMFRRDIKDIEKSSNGTYKDKNYTI